MQGMKIRGSIIWFIVVMAALIALALWYGKKKPVEMPPIASVETNTVPPAATVPSQPMSVPVHSTTSPAQVASSAPIVSNQPISPVLTDKAMLRQEILQANDADIVFYGRLEDQSGSAVGGAAVNFSIQYENANARGIQRGQVVSDGNGFFTISGYKGANLVIMPKKAAYALATTGTSFRYSQLTPGYFVPDAGNPTVIKMWKLQGAEPLVGINKTFKLPYTGEPIFFDLVTSNVVPAGGDLEVIVTRAPGVITQRNHGDWSIKLVPVNGGIMQTDYHTSQVTFDAPADGYQDNYLVQMDHDDPAWFDNIQRVFFLTSRNGQVYSKLSLDFKINDDPNGTMWLQFTGVANANGSRNWEATVPQ
jgi:hypothetical protein